MVSKPPYLISAGIWSAGFCACVFVTLPQYGDHVVYAVLSCNVLRMLIFQELYQFSGTGTTQIHTGVGVFVVAPYPVHLQLRDRRGTIGF